MRPIHLRTTACIAVVTFLVCLGRPGVADDALLASRDGELLMGPITRSANLQGVAVETRLSAFLSVHAEATGMRIRARILADLADLHHKIGDLVGLLPLPKDNCARRGRENLVVKLRESDLQVAGDRALIGLRGHLRVWACLDNPFSRDPIKSHLSPRLPFEASLPLRLTIDGPTSVALVFDRPTLEFEGRWGDVSDTVLTLAGVDVTNELMRILRRALRPEELQRVVPEELVPLGLEISSARLFGNSETLAAKIEVSADLGALRLAKIWALTDP